MNKKRKGTHISDEHKKKISIGNTGKKRSKELRDRIRASVISYLTSERHLNKRTNIEKIMEDNLTLQKIPFYSQFSVAGMFIADFFIPSLNTIIECDGDYWHSREELIRRDKIKNGLYKREGFRVLRFGEKEIEEDILSCIDVINSKEIANLFKNYEQNVYQWEIKLSSDKLTVDDLDGLDKLNAKLEGKYGRKPTP